MIILDTYNDNLYKLRSVGHHDSRFHPDANFFRFKRYWGLHYLHSGEGKLILRDREYDLFPGMYFLTPPYEPVNYYSSGPSPWVYYFIAAYSDSPIDLSTLINTANGQFTAISKNPKKISKLFENFFATKETNHDPYFSTLSLLHKILSVEFSEGFVPKNKIHAPEIVESAKELLFFNYRNPDFNITDIATMLHINPSQLSRTFKAETGETPISYLINLRLEYAAAHLQKRRYNVSELYSDCGFNDERYFMKRFKMKFGITVREYQERIKNNKL